MFLHFRWTSRLFRELTATPKWNPISCHYLAISCSLGCKTWILTRTRLILLIPCRIQRNWRRYIPIFTGNCTRVLRHLTVSASHRRKRVSTTSARENFAPFACRRTSMRAWLISFVIRIGTVITALAIVSALGVRGRRSRPSSRAIWSLLVAI